MVLILEYFVYNTRFYIRYVSLLRYKTYFSLFKKFLPLNFVAGAKPFPGFENLPRSIWHELSSPFTEVSCIYCQTFRELLS